MGWVFYWCLKQWSPPPPRAKWGRGVQDQVWTRRDSVPQRRHTLQNWGPTSSKSSKWKSTHSRAWNGKHSRKKLYLLPLCLCCFVSPRGWENNPLLNSTIFQKLLAPEDTSVYIPTSPRPFLSLTVTAPAQVSCNKWRQCHQVQGSAVQVCKSSISLPSSSEFNITNF